MSAPVYSDHATERARPRLTLQLLGIVALSTLVLLLLIATLGNLIPPYLTSTETLQPPSQRHWLGTNDIGQSVMTGLLRAAPVTIGLALATAALALLIGITMAGLAVMFPKVGRVIVLHLTDMAEIVPSILLLLLLSAWHQPGVIEIIPLMALLTWHDDVRILRSVLLREMGRENITLTRHMGARWPYLLLHHILPAILPTLTGLYLQNVVQATMRVAGLAFLGLTAADLLTWGSMLQDAMGYLHTPAWTWLLLPPAFCLTGFLLLLMALDQQQARRSSHRQGSAP
ncbi:ABC transporter permease [Epibacterium sp. Ofav1-8]|uniref:ABC transporter permease n=1 Tax=Epibacterium sp. Ofav1-8 TaxID=2917735 RepID=UPI001EF5898A|nr:ABC transporter permease subunit [Epibacterium sp. Ofav1-8]MCG7625858.1 ABC transporter permease subunit [Epibacterium sp. Ofav1-8]